MAIVINKNNLIRIVIVLITIGILVGIVLAVFSDSKKNGNDESRKHDIQKLAEAIGEYKSKSPLPASSGSWCELKQDGTGCPGFPGLISNYISVIPKDPDNGYYMYFSDSNNFALMATMSDGISTYIFSSFLGTYSLQKKNFLTINQSNGSENETLNGFESYKEASIESSNSVSYEERHSVKVNIKGNNSGVIVDSPLHNISIGNDISVQAMVWVPLGKSLSFGVRGDNGSGMREYSSKEIKGNNNWQMVQLSYKLEENWRGVGIIIHSANYNPDPAFYYFVDRLKLEYGDKISEWGIGI